MWRLPLNPAPNKFFAQPEWIGGQRTSSTEPASFSILPYLRCNLCRLLSLTNATFVVSRWLHSYCYTVTFSFTILIFYTACFSILRFMRSIREFRGLGHAKLAFVTFIPLDQIYFLIKGNGFPFPFATRSTSITTPMYAHHNHFSRYGLQLPFCTTAAWPATAETDRLGSAYVNDRLRGARLSFELFAHHVIAITTFITEPIYKRNKIVQTEIADKSDTSITWKLHHLKNTTAFMKQFPNEKIPIKLIICETMYRYPVTGSITNQKNFIIYNSSCTYKSQQ
jgi:hypothetical protein